MRAGFVSSALAAALAASVLAFAASPCRAALPVSLSADLAGHWAQTDIQRVIARGLMSTLEDGLFHPDAPAMRLDVVAALVCARGLRDEVRRWPITAPPCFADISPVHPAFGVTGVAFEAGMVKGYQDGTFRPGAPVTRVEAATMVAAGLEADLPATAPAAAAFADAAALPGWGLRAAWAMVASNAMRGYPDGTFRPSGLVSRAELAHMLAVLLTQRGALWDVAGELAAAPAAGWLALLPLGGGGGLRVALPAGTWVLRNGRPATPADLGPGDQITVILGQAGQATMVEAWWDDVTGDLLRVDPASRQLTVHTYAGEVINLPVGPGARIFRFGSPAGLSELAPADRLYLVFDHFTGAVRYVDAVAVEFSGRLVDVRSGQSSLSLRLPGGEVRRFTIWTGTTVFIDGRRSSWGDLLPGDNVVALATVGGTVAKYIEVVRAGAGGGLPPGGA